MPRLMHSFPGMRFVVAVLIGLLSLSAMVVSAGATEAAPHLGNFGGSGEPDLDWHNVTTGQVIIWVLNGLSISSTIPGVVNPGPNWHIVADVDLNGDGKSDILWRNVSTGENAVWINNGTSFDSYALETIADLNWQVAGTGDFDGDGKTDILWRNPQTGVNYIWFMNGASISSSAATVSVVDQNWHVAAVADFNGDGMADILWHNIATGQIVPWMMDGSALISSGAPLGSLPDQNWIVAAVDDFNGDGRAEILIRNPVSGENRMWTLDSTGTSIARTDWVESVTDPNWQIAATGDLNGDGNADLIWRNTSTGSNYVWYMEGATLLSSGSLQPLPDQSWQLISGVGPVVSSISLTSSPNPSNFGDAVSLTATFTTGAPTGTVTFKDGTTTLGAVTLSNGAATLKTSSLTVGSHSITVVYGGDSNFSPSTSPPVTQTVNDDTIEPCDL
jgi:hypothetical protein